MVYRLSIGSRIVFGLLSVGALAAGAYLVTIHSDPGIATLIRQLVGLLFVVAGLGGFLAIARFRLTIDEGTLTMNGLYTSRTIDLHEIDGYREGSRKEFSLVRKGGGRSITLPFGMEKRDEAIAWFKQRYEDVDQREHDLQEKALLEDERFGRTRKERKSRLKQANRLESYGMIAGFVLLFWAIFYPRPFGLMMWIELAAPWLGVLATARFAGMMRFSMGKRIPYPSMTILMLLPLIGGLIAVPGAYKVYSFPHGAWKMLIAGGLLTTIVVVALCYKAIAGEKRKLLVSFCILVLSAPYCWSLQLFGNCYYDRTVPVVVKVSVEGKRISSGKSRSYYLRLSPWGKYSSGKEVTVDRSFYEAVENGDSLRINWQGGRLGIPWYWLQK